MAAKLTRLSHKVAMQLHIAAFAVLAAGCRSGNFWITLVSTVENTVSHSCLPYESETLMCSLTFGPSCVLLWRKWRHLYRCSLYATGYSWLAGNPPNKHQTHLAVQEIHLAGTDTGCGKGRGDYKNSNNKLKRCIYKIIEMLSYSIKQSCPCVFLT